MVVVLPNLLELHRFRESQPSSRFSRRGVDTKIFCTRMSYVSL
jgi:hypothetical protein